MTEYSRANNGRLYHVRSLLSGAAICGFTPRQWQVKTTDLHDWQRKRLCPKCLAKVRGKA